METMTTTHEDTSTAVHYVARGGGNVVVPKSVNPYEELSIAVTATAAETKKAFKQRANCSSRQQRVMASLAYHMISSQESDECYSRNGNYFQIKKLDAFTLVAIGYTWQLLAEISRDKTLLNSVDNRGRTALYIASRCGFYDTTEALLKAGAAVNKSQANKSTPLHGAAYYGQAEIVKLLLVYGADPNAKNEWGNTPEKEAASDTIREILVNHKVDFIAVMASSFISKGLAVQVRLLEHDGKVIAKEILRSKEVLDPETRHIWMDAHSHWEVAWHGTKAKSLESIIHKGLLPSGSRLHDGTVIKPPCNHYQLSEEHFGQVNWAKAIFVSPDILYAAHVCYSERVMSGGEQWCVLVKTRVKPKSYTSHDATTMIKKEPIDGEPENPEYRIEVQSDAGSCFDAGSSSDAGSAIVKRVKSKCNVVVTSILFIKLNFLERDGLTYDMLESVMLK